MKTTTAVLLCLCFLIVGQTQSAKLTARQYQPSPIEALVVSMLSGMEEANQPLGDEISYLRSVLKEHPDENAIHRIYQDLMRRDSLETLRQEYEQLAQDNPDDPIYSYLNSRIAATSQDRWRWAAQTVRIDPNYYWGHIALGYHFLNLPPQPDLPKAEEELLRAVEIDNSIPAAFVNLALVYRLEADTAKMLEMYRLGSICDPNDFSLVIQRVNLIRATNLDKAVAEIQDFLKTHPDHEEALSSIRYLYILGKKYNDALAAAQKLITIGKPNADEWYDLATAYALAKQPDSAFSALDEAIKLGWNDQKYLSEDEDLASLHNDPRWAATKDKLQAELDRTAPQRKQEALQDYLNIPAPGFEFSDMDGKTVNLADYRGKVVVLDFWALWCHWCLKAMPMVEKFWKEYKDRGVVVLSMNVRENRRKDVPKFIQDSGYTFRVVYGDDKVYNDYGIRGIPAMFIIDKQGIIRYRNIGYSPLLDETLSWQVDSLLK